MEHLPTLAPYAHINESSDEEVMVLHVLLCAVSSVWNVGNGRQWISGRAQH